MRSNSALYLWASEKVSNLIIILITILFMKKVVYTVILLLLTLTYSYAQWRQFPCTITGNNDFGHSSSVSNNFLSTKKSIAQFNENNQDLSKILPADNYSDAFETKIYHVNCDVCYITIKSNQSNILKRRE